MTEAIKNDMHQSTENSQNSLEGTLKPAPISLRPLKPKFLNDLIRIGARGDGGYVLNEASVRHSQYLLSFGINDEWSFESEFLTRKDKVKIFCFDHSVSKAVFKARMRKAIHDILSFKLIASAISLKRARILQLFSDLRHWTKIHSKFSRFVSNQNVRFFPKGISNEKNDQFITFTEAFQLISPAKPPENSVFVKIDIEQSEYRVLPAILSAQHYINGMVVEFHDLDILWGEFLEITQQLTQYFEITRQQLWRADPELRRPSRSRNHVSEKSIDSTPSNLPSRDVPNSPVGFSKRHSKRRLSSNLLTLKAHRQRELIHLKVLNPRVAVN